MYKDENKLIFEIKEEFPRIDQLLFPTNEGNFKVKEIINADTRDSKKLRIVSGYSGLDQIIDFISQKSDDLEIEIVFGNEPNSKSSARIRKTNNKQLDDEMRDYWLERRLSPRNHYSIINAIESIKTGNIKARIHKGKFLHAKVYQTDTTIIMGSSNFTKPGLETSRELNARFNYGTEEYVQLSKFIDGCWNHSEDYTIRLLKLLEDLYLHTTWMEALSRSCAAILEGSWAADLLTSELRENMEKLWPHQIQGIAQALTVLETQGAVVIADATGSGKTKTGGWLFRLSFNRMISRGGEKRQSLIPIMIAPSSVTNNWHRILDEVNVPREVMSMGILSNNKSESTKRRLELIEKTDLLAVDEIHNYYTEKSKRTKRLNSNLAESRIFLTATPINRKFSDLTKLMGLLGTADLDGDTFREMKRLEENINHKNKMIREKARKQAKSLVQKFMVRRTRDDLNSMVDKRPEDYRVGSEIAKYPGYNSEFFYYDNSNKDKKIISNINKEVEQLKGLTRLSSDLKLTKKQKENGLNESSYLKSRIAASKGMTKYQIWNSLDSSKAALYEHALGTDYAEKKYNIKTNKNIKSRSRNKIEQLKQMTIPKWELSEELKNISSIPKWIHDEQEFELAKKEEIKLYESIINYLNQLSEDRLYERIEQIKKVYNQNKKILAFDSSIITLTLYKDILDKENYENYLFTGVSPTSKGKRVIEAEKLFGLKSDNLPRIGLLSDSMSEGINLQGTNVLIHLTAPSTIKRAEQRVGRVDRMDSKFKEINILYPERDTIGKKVKDHLSERAELVNDVIGSNLKLPGENDISEDEEIETDLEKINENLFKNNEGLFDAFHNVRGLIGDKGLVSEEDYEMMRSSDVKVVSCVGLVASKKPWCLAVIQTNKDWAPQWVKLDWGKRNAKKTRGIETNLDLICQSLRENMNGTSDTIPSTHTEKWMGKYIDHLRINEIQLLPIRKRAAIEQMITIMKGWRVVVGPNTDFAKFLSEIINNARNGTIYDLRDLARVWSDYMKSNKEHTINGRRRNAKKKYERKIIENPPKNTEEFMKKFSNIMPSEDIESRIVAMIGGIPPSNYYN